MVDPRSTSGPGTVVDLASPLLISPDTSLISRSTAAAPIAATSWLTVDSGGLVRLAMGRSSKPDHGDVVGYAEPRFGDRLQRAGSHHVVAGEHRVGVVGEQPAHRLVAGLDREVAMLDEASVDLDPVAVQRPLVTDLAVAAVDAIRRTEDDGDPASPARDQMIDGGCRAGFIGDLDVRDVRSGCVSANEHARVGTVEEVLDPWRPEGDAGDDHAVDEPRSEAIAQ